MTAPRDRELEAVTQAYHLALVEIGVATLADAILLWDDVPATQKAATATRWLHSAIEMIMSHRGIAVELGRAYYRLARALATGKTVADPNRPEPTGVITLAELRHQFNELAKPSQSERAASEISSPAPAPEVAQQPTTDTQETTTDAVTVDDDERILVEEIAELDRLEAEAERAAEEEIAIDLAALGPEALEKAVKEIDDELPASEVDKLRNDAHEKAGARQAAAAERIAMNGARAQTWTMQEADKGALGWVRISLTGTPCGWCAMLISRGFVAKNSALYGSKKSAEYSDGDKYHDNDHCVSVPVFSKEQMDSADTFKLNREYAEQWPIVTEGLKGKAAVSAWRRFIRQQQK